MLAGLEEKNVLVDLIKNRYDYDFSGYSESSIVRRINKFCHRANFKSLFVENKSIFNT